MKYWQVHKVSSRGVTPIKTWSIEYEDGTYLTIAIRNYDNEPGRGWVSRSTAMPIMDKTRGITEILKEVPKEDVLEALKTVLEILDLPQEINILKHKFNYAEE